MKREKRGKPVRRDVALGSCEGATSRWRVVLDSLTGLVLLLGIPVWGGAQTTIGKLPPAQHVLDVNVEKGDQEDRVVILVDGGIEPNVFPYEGPENPMVVVDIPETTKLTNKTEISVDSPRLQRVRIGEHTSPTKVRVVLDLLYGVAYDVVKLVLYLGDPENPKEIPTRFEVTIRKAEDAPP